MDWSAPENAPVRPAVLGTKVYLDLDIEELLPYIDWNPFFQVWLGIAGRLQLSLSLTALQPP